MSPRLAVHRLLPQGQCLSRTLVARAAAVSLDWDRRQRSRLAALDNQGRELAIVLARGSVMRGGDVLVADDGSLVRIVAAEEPLAIARPRPGAEGAYTLLRAAYHLGNRHVSLDLRPDSLRLAPDPVLEDLLRRMGLEVERTQAAFEPEGGAYAAAGGGHAHHHHDHDHDHDHGHPGAGA